MMCKSDLRRSVAMMVASCMAVLVITAAGAFVRASPADRESDRADKSQKASGNRESRLAKDDQEKKPDETAEVRLSPEAAKRYGIKIGTTRKQKLTAHLIVPAQVSFNTSAMAVVGCPVQGRVTELKADVGNLVQRGDELLVVESPELGEAQSDYMQKRTAVIAAGATVDPTRSAYERARKLYEASQGIALTELQKRELEYKTAQNALLTAQAAAKAAESRLRLLGMGKEAIDHVTLTGEIDPRYVVRAPLAGTVTERTVTLGELVKPDREKLLVVADLTSLWVIADVPEARVGEVKPGAKASVSLGEQSVDGTVSLVGISVDPSTRSVPVRIQIPADPALKPGMFAQGDIVSTAGDAPVVAVPASAIQSVDGSTAVFLPVEGQPNTFTRRMVSVGDSAGGMVSIISGLDEGEPVVTSGAFILKAELGKASARDTD